MLLPSPHAVLLTALLFFYLFHPTFPSTQRHNRDLRRRRPVVYVSPCAGTCVVSRAPCFAAPLAPSCAVSFLVTAALIFSPKPLATLPPTLATVPHSTLPVLEPATVCAPVSPCCCTPTASSMQRLFLLIDAAPHGTFPSVLSPRRHNAVRASREAIRSLWNVAALKLPR